VKYQNTSYLSLQLSLRLAEIPRWRRSKSKIHYRAVTQKAFPPDDPWL
jgi:hypothetical protein